MYKIVIFRQSYHSSYAFTLFLVALSIFGSYSVMQKCWNEEPEMRGTFDELQEALNNLAKLMSASLIEKEKKRDEGDLSLYLGEIATDDEGRSISQAQVLARMSQILETGTMTSTGSDSQYQASSSYLRDDEKESNHTLYVDEVSHMHNDELI